MWSCRKSHSRSLSTYPPEVATAAQEVQEVGNDYEKRAAAKELRACIGNLVPEDARPFLCLQRDGDDVECLDMYSEAVFYATTADGKSFQSRGEDASLAVQFLDDQPTSKIVEFTGICRARLNQVK